MKLKNIMLTALAIVGLALLTTPAIQAQSCDGTGKKFVDLNGDGFNDNAPDQDGDGIPNGLDPDYVKYAQDGDGYKHGKLGENKGDGEAQAQTKAQAGTMAKAQDQTMTKTQLKNQSMTKTQDQTKTQLKTQTMTKAQDQTMTKAQTMAKIQKFNRLQAFEGNLFQKRLGALGGMNGSGAGVCDGMGVGLAGSGVCDGTGPKGVQKQSGK